MAEGIFSIFPDGQLTSGHGLKGNVPRSKKKALCDVKNTLLSKRTGLNEPLRKLNLDQGEGSCKQPIKETPVKVTSKQEGTFTIALDKENEVFWDECNNCIPSDNDLFSFRPESTLLNNEDVDYLAKGFMALPREDTVTLPEDDMSLFRLRNDDWFDELITPPISPPAFDVDITPILLPDED